MITKETKALVEEMENSNIFMNTQMTNNEYTEDLLKFQTMLAQLVFNDKEATDNRLDETIIHLETLARRKGLENDPTIRLGISHLKKVNREICISMAGRNGENRVARALEFVTRANTSTYRNVYIADEENETELDNVVLTDAGIVILEIKSAKDNITISEDGRILYNNEVCNEKKSFGEKMQNKRNLLRDKLETALFERNLHLPIHIDSFLVLSTPKSVRININDQYKKEKFCFHGKLPSIIDEYSGKVAYNNYELTQLKGILDSFASCEKRFDLSLNFDEIRRDLAKALVLLWYDEAKTTRNIAAAESTKTIKQTRTKFRLSNRLSGKRHPSYIAGGFIAGIILVGALIGAASQNSSFNRA